MKKHLALSIKFCLLLTCLFLVHRLFIFSDLSINLVKGFPAALESFLIGFLSDFWISCLFSFIFFGVFYLSEKISKKDPFLSLFYLIFSVALAILLTFHLPYVEFFKNQLTPFHVTYIFDFDFILAYGTHSLNFRTFSCALIFGLFIWMLLGQRRFFAKNIILHHSTKFYAVFLTLLWVLGFLSHLANIKYKVQKFIPYQLQANVIEKIYLDIFLPSVPPALSSEDLFQLNSFLNPENSLVSTTNETKTLKSILEVNFKDGNEQNQLLLSLKKTFQHKLALHEKPIILVVLMESLRYIDTGLGKDSNESSLTPYFDELARESFVSAHAYSTGTVTRGAQEAILCGYPGSQNLSTMRPRTDINLTCLSDLIKRQNGSTSPKYPGFTFWLHGGEGRFDSQQVFWLNHGFDLVSCQTEFPSTLPKTGWGISDLSFFTLATDKIISLRQSSSADYFLGMLLSVSNHIPWNLPSDAPERIKSRLPSGSHPSFLTTKYSDYALGYLVTKLKETTLWKDTILIVTGDHGSTLPVFGAHSAVIAPADSADLLSHVPLVVGGGLLENEINNHKEVLKKLQNQYVSHLAIASFISYLLNINGLTIYAPPLFSSQNGPPVFSDQGNSVYFPELGLSLETKKVISSASSYSKNPRENVFLLYYKSFLRLISFLSVKK